LIARRLCGQETSRNHTKPVPQKKIPSVRVRFLVNDRVVAAKERVGKCGWEAVGWDKTDQNEEGGPRPK